MRTPHDLVADACARALDELASDHRLDVAATVQLGRNPDLGDYQCNAALRLAKPLDRKPPEIAGELASRIEAPEVIDPPEVAPPGFVNLRLKDEWLAAAAGERAAAGDVRLGPASATEHVVVDFSSPN